MPARITVIEDEKDIRELVSYTLRQEGFEVTSCATGREGLDSVRRGRADLAVIDIMLPDVNGLEVCKRIRADEVLCGLPVVFLTARGAEVDRILGLELGGDDYLVKPFSPRELVARIRAVLRRQHRDPADQRPIERGDLRLNPDAQEVIVRGKAVDLSALEFRLLYCLASNPRRVFSREKLLDQAWGRDRFVTPRTVDVHIRRLREKIEADPESPRYLQTVRGSGYRFCDVEAGNQTFAGGADGASS